MQNVQNEQIEIKTKTHHSAFRGYTEERDTGNPRVGSASRLDRSHVDDTPDRSERRSVFFAEQGLYSLGEAHARFVQSLPGNY